MNTQPADNFILFPNIVWEGAYSIGHYSVIGQPFAGSESAETRIGDNATIRSHSVIYAGNRIGRNFQTGHGVMIRELNQIGDDVSIGTHSIVEHHVVIGNGVRIHSNVFIPEYCVLEDECWIGPAVVMTNAPYPRSKDVKSTLKGAVIERGAKIGAGAVLLPGVRIGKHALIGSGAVVTRDVEEHGVVVGNPARLINHITNIPEYQ
jgi:acetyltransferase-like isoleucine patch superfamily enzyme